MKDCRAIKTDAKDKKSLFYFLKYGIFKQFVDLVKKSKSTNKELMLCFRTSKGKESVIIYYNNHQVWKLYVKDGVPYVEISGNHARDSLNWRDLLMQIGISKEEIKVKSEGIGEKEIDFKKLIFFGNQIDDNFANRTLPPIIIMINDYFDITKNTDYFKNGGKGAPHKKSNGEIGKRDLEEKRQQQLFYLQNKDFKDGLFVYDMEFAQEYESDKEKKADLAKMGINSGNQTDCLGIRFDKSGNPISLVYIEIKSKKTSVTQKGSGLKEHLMKMDAYLTVQKNETIEDTHIPDRVEEAKKIIECYRKLGLRNVPKSFDCRSLDILKNVERQEVMIVFTGENPDGAINYCFKKGRANTINIMKPYIERPYTLSWWPNLM